MKTATALLHNKPHLISAFILLVILTLVASYVYLLSLTVVHVVMRKEIDRDISNSHSEISTLEAEYMSVQHRISNEITSRTDLAITSEKVFLNKTESGLVLSSLTN